MISEESPARLLESSVALFLSSVETKGAERTDRAVGPGSIDVTCAPYRFDDDRQRRARLAIRSRSLHLTASRLANYTSAFAPGSVIPLVLCGGCTACSCAAAAPPPLAPASEASMAGIARASAVAVEAERGVGESKEVCSRAQTGRGGGCEAAESEMVGSWGRGRGRHRADLVVGSSSAGRKGHDVTLEQAWLPSQVPVYFY